MCVFIKFITLTWSHGPIHLELTRLLISRNTRQGVGQKHPWRARVKCLCVFFKIHNIDLTSWSYSPSTDKATNQS